MTTKFVFAFFALAN